jgi:hypothetical protein
MSKTRPQSSSKATARAVGTLASKARAASAKQAEAKRRRAEALLALVQRRKQHITEDFYDIGEALRELLRKKLYEPLGFASFDDLVRAHDLMSVEQARKLVALVEHMPREEALRLGQEKAYALVAYTLATPEPDVPADLVRADVKLGDKPLSEASVRDIKAAAAEARKKQPKKPLGEAERARLRRDKHLLAAARLVLKRAGVNRSEIVVRRDKVVITLAASTVERLARA